MIKAVGWCQVATWFAPPFRTEQVVVTRIMWIGSQAEQVEPYPCQGTFLPPDLGQRLQASWKPSPECWEGMGLVTQGVCLERRVKAFESRPQTAPRGQCEGLIWKWQACPLRPSQTGSCPFRPLREGAFIPSLPDLPYTYCTPSSANRAWEWEGFSVSQERWDRETPSLLWTFPTGRIGWGGVKPRRRHPGDYDCLWACIFRVMIS